MTTDDYIAKPSYSHPRMQYENAAHLVTRHCIDTVQLCPKEVCRRLNFVPTAPPLEIVSTLNDKNYVDNYISKALYLTESSQNTEDRIQQEVAVFCSCGNANVLHLTEEHFHLYMHIAMNLHYPTLIQHCLKFYDSITDRNNIWTSKLSLCSSCASALQDKTYIHGNVNKNNSENSQDSPTYIILFLKSTHAVNKNESHNVGLVNGRNLDNFIKLKVKKVLKFGDGFAVCSAQLNKCPFVFFSGGGTSRTSNAVWQYDVILNKWVHLANMTHSRAKHGIAFVQGSVYVFGGKMCTTIEKISISTHTCHVVAQLPIGVHSFAFVVFEDKIFIFGGRAFRQNVSHIQCFDTKTNRVSRLPDMPIPCSGGQAIAIKNTIYFATHDGYIIKFNPVSGKSDVCTQQPYKRKHFIVLERNEMLYIFGGIKTDEPFEKDGSMNKYCPVSGTWKFERSYEHLLPVTASCNVLYPKQCPVRPFVKHLC